MKLSKFRVYMEHSLSKQICIGARYGNQRDSVNIPWWRYEILTFNDLFRNWIPSWVNLAVFLSVIQIFERQSYFKPFRATTVFKEIECYWVLTLTVLCQAVSGGDLVVTPKIAIVRFTNRVNRVRFTNHFDLSGRRARSVPKNM